MAQDLRDHVWVLTTPNEIDVDNRVTRDTVLVSRIRWIAGSATDEVQILNGDLDLVYQSQAAVDNFVDDSKLNIRFRGGFRVPVLTIGSVLYVYGRLAEEC